MADDEIMDRLKDLHGFAEVSVGHFHEGILVSIGGEDFGTATTVSADTARAFAALLVQHADQWEE